MWGSGLDTTLNDLRDVIRTHGTQHFPVNELEVALAKRGRTLRFEEAEIQDLADLAYGDKRTFPLLSLLYPFIDLRNEFHIDHVFPQTKFKRQALRQAGIDPDAIDGIQDHAQRLGNLQLLQGSLNMAKNDAMPNTWLDTIFKDNKPGRDDYLHRHDIPQPPEDINSFETFYNGRRERITARLRELFVEPQAKTGMLPTTPGG